MDPLSPAILKAARTAAREAGRIQLAGMNQSLDISHKGRFDLVTDVDRRCEETIKEILHQALPSAGLLAEESSPEGLDKESVWIIDPLDGTTNYAHAYPAFCSVIALRHAGDMVLGVVFDPLRQELFEARRQQGAFLNGKRIQVSQTDRLSQSLLATGFAYDRLEHAETNLDRFCALTMRSRGVRRGGSAALDLCYTACGRLDGFWELRLNPWDVGAGALMVQEAGGRVTDLDGRAYDFSGVATLATNGHLHANLMHSLTEAWPPGPCYG